MPAEPVDLAQAAAPLAPKGTIFARQFFAAMFCSLRLESGNAVCRRPPAKGTALGDTGDSWLTSGCA